jgi:tetraacyldisaccharide 4'-kinase
VRDRSFADHHPFSEGEIESLVAGAGRDQLTPVTTEKDFARLRGLAETPAFLRDIVPFAVTLEFADQGRLRKFLSDRLFRAREKRFQKD